MDAEAVFDVKFSSSSSSASKLHEAVYPVQIELEGESFNLTVSKVGSSSPKKMMSGHLEGIARKVLGAVEHVRQISAGLRSVTDAYMISLDFSSEHQRQAHFTKCLDDLLGSRFGFFLRKGKPTFVQPGRMVVMLAFLSDGIEKVPSRTIIVKNVKNV